MNCNQLTYALSRHIPDMQQRAFTIQTTYGELEIPVGKLADAIANLVRKHYETELASLALGQVAEQAKDMA